MSEVTFKSHLHTIAQSVLFGFVCLFVCFGKSLLTKCFSIPKGFAFHKHYGKTDQSVLRSQTCSIQWSNNLLRLWKHQSQITVLLRAFFSQTITVHNCLWLKHFYWNTLFCVPFDLYVKKRKRKGIHRKSKHFPLYSAHWFWARLFLFQWINDR